MTKKSETMGNLEFSCIKNDLKLVKSNFVLESTVLKLGKSEEPKNKEAGRVSLANAQKVNIGFVSAKKSMLGKQLISTFLHDELSSRVHLFPRQWLCSRMRQRVVSYSLVQR